jgi:hypothetical protein
MATLVERAIGAARLDVATYEEVEHDESALGQAMTVVVIAALAAGIGSAGHGIVALLGGAIANLVGWFAWAFVIYLVGTKALPTAETQADLGQLLRTTGFSASPGVLSALGIVPIIGGLAVLIAGLWQLASMVVAVRQALDYTSTGRAVAVCLIGFAVYLLIAVVLVGLLMGAGMWAGSQPGAVPAPTVP